MVATTTNTDRQPHPSRLVAHYADDPTLRIVAAPTEIEAMDYRMSGHPRLDDDPAQRWLRDTIRSISADITNAAGAK
jgi:DNA-binding transcriptional LysR family regulator